MKVNYEVTTLRAGQPRAYADSEYEYVIKITSEDQYGPNKGAMSPYIYYGDIEERIKREESQRKAGTMIGGYSPDKLRKEQRDWAKKVVASLCRKFREPNDDDGRTGMEAYFYPTLKSLTLNHAKGEIRVLIIEPYTD